MDNDLVEFAMKCPISLKLNNLENVVRFNENEAGNKQKNYFLKNLFRYKEKMLYFFPDALPYRLFYLKKFGL